MINLGNALDADGRTREAISRYEEAVGLEPGSAEAHLSLGLALARIPGRLDEARAHLGAYLKIRPEDAEARRILDSIQAPKH